MAVPGPARRPLLYGSILGVFTLAATAWGTSIVGSRAPIDGSGALLDGFEVQRYESPARGHQPEARGHGPEQLRHGFATRGRDLDELRHRLEHNFVTTGAGVAVKYEKVRVAIGLAHMADDLRKYAARASCPVAILRGTRSSELTMAEAKEIAGCWPNAAVVDVEGDYALQMENPVGLAEALAALAARAGV